MPSLTVVKEANELQSDEQQQDDDGTHSSFVPITVKRKSEEEAVQKAVKDRQKSKTVEVVPWPARGNVPLNEFISEGYISCAFPTLLPTGDADFLAPRQRAVTVGNYFKHLLRNEDGRFAKRSRFRYFALNTEMRWRALQNGRIYIKNIPKMRISHCRISKKWSAVEVSNLQSECYIIPAVCVGQDGTGFSRKAD